MFNDRNYTFLNFSSLHGFLSLKISLIILLFIIFVDFVILNHRNDFFFLKISKHGKKVIFEFDFFK